MRLAHRYQIKNYLNVIALTSVIWQFTVHSVVYVP